MVLWGNFSYPNSNNWKKIQPLGLSTPLTTRWLNFPIPISFWGLWKHTPIYGPVASIWYPKVPNSSKSGYSLPKQDYWSSEWKLSSVSNKRKQLPTIDWPDFLFRLFIAQSYSRIHILWILIGHKYSFPVWMEEWERKSFEEVNLICFGQDS